MLLITAIFVGLLWLVFFKLRLLPWNWPWRIVSALSGFAILATFLALLNTLAPTGRVAVVGRVVEITPNVAGQVTAIEVKADVPVKAGDVLFRIDRTPFEAKVRQLQANFVDAQQKAKRIAVDLEQARADVVALEGQVSYAERRRDDLDRLARAASSSEFRLQDFAAQADTIAAQLQAARSRETSALLAVNSQVEGENTLVAQLRAQLDIAKWELEQTVIRAPGDGFVSVVPLAVGDRATPFKAVMPFIVSEGIGILGFFPQNGSGAISEGTPVMISFANYPGRVYRTKVEGILKGVGEGQVAVSGTIARTTTVNGAAEHPVRIAVPDGLDRDSLRLGMAGPATAISPNAGPVGLIATVLMHVKSLLLFF